MSPQKENGYTAIANEIMEALAKYSIPGAQMQCLLFILRKTYGYNKKNDAISLSQFEKGTGISRRNVVRAINQLKKRNIVCVKKGGVKNDTMSTSKYRFNKQYKKWKDSVINDTGSVKYGQKVVSNMTHTKDIITKDKEILTYLSTDALLFVKKFIEHIKKTKCKKAPVSKNLLENSSKTVDLLIRKDGFELDYIRKVLWWAIQDDSFWAGNLLSLASLRKKNDDLVTKFQSIANKYDENLKNGGLNGSKPNYTKIDKRKPILPTRTPTYED